MVIANIIEIIAQGYKDALIEGADMQKATDALTAIRTVSSKDNLYRTWEEIDNRIGLTLDMKDLALDEHLRTVLIHFRDRFEEELRAAVIGRLREVFEQDPLEGWKSWIKIFAEALSLWRFSLCTAMTDEPFPFPEEKRVQIEDIRRAMPFILHERWPEAKGLFEAVSVEADIEPTVRAKLLVVCGEIELFHFENFGRADQFFSSAERLARDEGRVICGRAEYHLALDKIDEAKKAFQRTIKKAPNLADGYAGMGEIYERQSELRSSEEWYREAVRVASGNTWGYIKLMRLYGKHELFPSSEVKAAEEKALVLYEHVCRLNPFDAYSAAVDMGNSYQHNGMSEEAQEWFQKAINLDPLRLGGYTASGYAHLSDKRFDPARARFEQVVEAVPDAFDGPWAMASLLEQESRWEDALMWCERSMAKRPERRTAVKARMYEITWGHMDKTEEAEEGLLALLREEPGNSMVKETLHRLADTYGHDRRTDQAVRIVTAISTILGKSYDAEYWYRVGNAKVDGGLLEEAAESYRQAISLDDDKAIYFTGLGETLRKLRMYGEAEEAFRQALSIEPDRPDYLNSMGNVLFENGKYSESAPYYEKASIRSPLTAVYHANLGGAYQELGDPDKAKDAYEEAIRLDPDNDDYKDKLGSVLYELGRYRESIAYHEQAIEIQPENARYRANLGRSHGRLGNWEAMIDHCKKAVELRRGAPDDPDGFDYYYEFLAEGYFKAGRIKEFEEYLEKSTDFEGSPEKKAVVYNHVGNLLAAAQENEQAIVYYDKATSTDNTKPIYECNTGVTYQSLGRWNEMIDHCKKAVELRRGAPDDLWDFDYYYEFLAEGYFKAGRIKEFEEYLEKSTDFEGSPEKKAVVYNRVGNLFFDKEEYIESVPFYAKAAELAPSMGVYHANLGGSHRALTQWEEARVAYAKAVDVEPGNGEYQNILGYIYFILGRHEASLPYYRTAIEINPSNALYYSNIGTSYAELKQWGEAKTAFSKAIDLDPQPLYLCNAASVCRELGEYDKMIEYSGKAIELRREKPNDSYGFDYYYEFLAEGYFKAGRIKEFEEYLEKSTDFEGSPEKKAVVYNWTGGLFAREGRYEEGRPYAEKALELAPRTPIYEFNLGLADRGTGRWETAIVHYTKALELRREAQEDSYGFDYYYEFLAEGYFKAGRIKEFEEYLEKSTDFEGSPEKKAVVYNRIGNLYFDIDGFSDAIPWYSSAIDAAPSVGIYYANRALSRSRVKLWADAEEDYQEAITLEPTNPEYHNMLGNVYFETESHQQAIDAYQRAFAIENQPIYACNLGRTYGNLGRWEEMIGFCSKALDLRREKKNDPYGVGYYYRFLVEAYVSAGKTAELGEILDLSEDFSTDPGGKAELYSLAGNLLFRAGRYDDAVNFYFSAVELAPSIAVYFVDLGLALQYKGDLLNAGKAYLEAIRLDPANHGYQNFMGNLYFYADEFALAAEKYLEAISLNAPIADYRENLVLACKEIGKSNKQEALSFLEKAMSYESTSPVLAEAIRDLEATGGKDTPPA
ncbi:MAG: photosystem I assembly protein Ycf3 [Syntrophorhabdus sp. PtaU1.Bin002]|nr:MAG: photosystem I assembly protein Ycf3 [Syntrophorhabdus sp. PtaU1.Bin002]